MNHENHGGNHRLARCMKLKSLLDSGITDRKHLVKRLGVTARTLHRDMHVIAEFDGGPASLVQRRRNRKKT